MGNDYYDNFDYSVNYREDNYNYDYWNHDLWEQELSWSNDFDYDSEYGED